MVKEKAFLSAKEKAHDREQRYYELLARGAKKSNLEKLVRTSSLLKARALKRSAIKAIAEKKLKLIAAKFIRDAIDSLNQFKVSERIRDSYYKRLERYQGVGIATEFITWTHSIDAKNTVAVIREKVCVSERINAIRGFTELYEPPSFSSALKDLKRKDRGILNLFARVSYDGRSKITATSSSHYEKIKISGEEVDVAELIEYYSFNQKYFGGNVFNFAILEMNSLNYYDKEFFRSLVERSPVVFEDQIELTTSALYYGMNSQIHKFAYIGVPLFENILRNLLKLTGVSVLHQEVKTNIQKEYNLDSILNHPNIKIIFKEAGILDLKALLTDPNGSQLRHNIAHGFASDLIKYNPIVYYFYFIFLKLIFKSANISLESEENWVI